MLPPDVAPGGNTPVMDRTTAQRSRGGFASVLCGGQLGREKILRQGTRDMQPQCLQCLDAHTYLRGTRADEGKEKIVMRLRLCMQHMYGWKKI